MPARYEGIKHSLMEKGYTEEEAKTSAAKIYNSTRRHDEPALTPNYDANVSKRNHRKKK